MVTNVLSHAYTTTQPHEHVKTNPDALVTPALTPTSIQHTSNKQCLPFDSDGLGLACAQPLKKSVSETRKRTATRQRVHT